MNFKQLLLRIMKLTFYGIFLQCLVLNFLFASEINAQEQSSVKDVFISLKLKNVSLSDAFKQIEDQTDFIFSYDLRHIEGKVPINIEAQSKSVAEILLEISEQASLKFKQVNNNINVEKLTTKDRKADKLEIIIQTRTITGKVTSMEDNEGLPGVNVVEKGTSNGTVTDIDGVYSLVVSEGATLVFSSVGYTQEEVEVGNRSTIDLVMTQDIQQLEELVVVGYGTQKKVNVTGSVETMDSEEIEKLNVTQTSQLLTGQLSGVTVTQNSGQPGKDNVQVRVRGMGTFSGAGNSPLILVDGLASSLDRVDFNDIASISVLKDAASSAIYGARGANGVIQARWIRFVANKKRMPLRG